MDIVPAAHDGSRNQRGKTHRVAYRADAGDVERKLIHVFRGDFDIVLYAVGLDQRSIRRYRNRRRTLSNRQFQVDSCRLSNKDGDAAADQRGEAGGSYRYRIVARGHLRYGVVSSPGRDG